MGVPIGSLKKLASEGKLTSEKLMRAFTDPKYFAALDAEAKQIPATFGDALTAVKNMATVAFGGFDKGGQFSQALYGFANQGTDNMGTIANAATQAGADTRLAFEGLGNAFEPLRNAATNVMDFISGRTSDLGIQFREVLGLFDEISNLGIGVTRAGEWARQKYEDAKAGVTGQQAGQVNYTPWANSAGQYDKGQSL
jgi:hypothetical protein